MGKYKIIWSDDKNLDIVKSPSNQFGDFRYRYAKITNQDEKKELSKIEQSKYYQSVKEEISKQSHQLITLPKGSKLGEYDVTHVYIDIPGSKKKV